MNDVFSFLNLTIEIAEDFEDKKLPTLDLKVWMSLDNKILFEFYEKPMNTNMVLQRKSALSENIKMNSLTQEVIRRMLNCCELAENSCRVESLNNLAVKMCTSGYDTRYIRKVFVAGIKGYEKKLENSRKPHTDPKYKPLHLAKTYNASKRLNKKIQAKNNWYRQSKTSEEDEDNVEVEKVMKQVNRTSKNSRRMESRKGRGQEKNNHYPPPQ